MSSTPLPPMAKGMKQCQNCLKTGTDKMPLLSCVCKRGHYCSKDCQKADWKKHKVLCQMTRNVRDTLKNHPHNSAMSLVGVSVVESENLMKKWVQHYRPLLSHTAIHALKIQTSSERCLTHVLLIALSPTFTATNFPRKDTEIRRAFNVEDVEVLSMKELEESKRGAAQNCGPTREQSLALRTQDPNAIGFLIVVLVAPACNMARITPLGVKGPPSILPPWNPQWGKKLELNISLGTAI